MLGQQIAQFRIVEKLGEGGMGVVFRARDTYLDRDVALKIISSRASADPQRRERFIREAKAASGLNHPCIVTIYEIGHAEGVDFIAMEYIGGRTLRDLIGPQGLPLKDALAYAAQIADALASAHAAGIVHRDLKPANIMVTERGLVKVLDFGLAKLVEPDSAGPGDAGETVSFLRTEFGTIVGTAAYMSPEQAEGKKVDHRSDIFTFGAVLYEMVTGRRPFVGETAMSVLSSVILKDPTPVSEVKAVPDELERIILRCMRKNPDQRIQHLDDLKVTLEELRAESITGRMVRTSVTQAPVRRRPTVTVAAVLAGLAVIGGLAWWWIRRPAPFAGAPVLTRLTYDSGLATDPALSRDGKLLAYASDRAGAGNLDLWVQHAASSEPTRLTSDDADDLEPAFSPDGSRIAFRSDRDGGGIYVVSSLGGEARKIASLGRRPRFSPDGNWIAYWVGDPAGSFLFPGNSKIYVSAASGGTPRQLVPEFAAASYPVWSPDGSRVLFLGTREGTARGSEGLDWWVAPLAGGPAADTGSRPHFLERKFRRPVIPGEWMASGDRVLFSTATGDSTNIWSTRVSAGRWRLEPEFDRLTAGTTLDREPGVAVDASGGIRLVFTSMSESTDIWSLPVNASSATPTGPLQRLTEDAASKFHPDVSATGRKIVFSANRSGNQDIFVKDLGSGRETRLTDAAANEDLPILSADESKVAYRIYYPSANRQEIWTVPASGGIPERVCENCGYPRSWSSDGKAILYLGRVPARVSILDIASGRKRAVLSHDPVRLWSPRLSPGGRWMVFAITQAPSRFQLRILPAGAETGQAAVEQSIPITDDASWNDKPYWSPDGTMLYFVSDRDGFRCVWAQRLDVRTGQPRGGPLAAYHSHSLRRALGNVGNGPLDISVASDKVVFPMGDRTGNIWLAEWKPR